MGYLSVCFDERIYGIRYIIKKYISLEKGQRSQIESSIPKDAPMVYSIEYSEETKTFQMTDFIEVCGRKVKVMFNLDLNLNIVGYIYNDLDDSYDTINPADYFTEDVVIDADYIYEEYKKRLKARLSEVLENQERKYKEDNYKMLMLKNNN